MTDDAEAVRRYIAGMTDEEVAAFIAGLGYGLGFGHSWIADTARRLLPSRELDHEGGP